MRCISSRVPHMRMLCALASLKRAHKTKHSDVTFVANAIRTRRVQNKLNGTQFIEYFIYKVRRQFYIKII